MADTVAESLSRLLNFIIASLNSEPGRVGAIRLLRYSVTEQFRQLWASEAAATLSSPAGPVTLVVLWDGFPPAQGNLLVDTARHLTPLDWAAAFTLSLRHTPEDQWPELRLLILDSPGRQSVQADCLSLLQSHGGNTLPGLPWVRVVNLHAETDVRKTILEATHLPTCHESHDVFHEHAAILSRQWQGSILMPSEPDGHHALSNLIGSLLLLPGSSAREEPHTAAIAQLLEWIGVMPLQPRPSVMFDPPPWLHWNEIAPRVGRFPEAEPFRALLADDGAFAHLWAEVLQVALGVRPVKSVRAGPDSQPVCLGTVAGQPALELHATGDPAGWLVSVLDAAAGTPALYRFGLDATRPLDWLFLDLRLFQGRHIEEEAEFVRRLRGHAESLDADPRFADLAQVDAWLAAVPRLRAEARRHPAYPSVLSLPARLLSVLDPALPIIVFAATGRRDVIGRFADFPNIITRFEKPRVQCPPPDDSAGDARARFREAIAQAAPLACARRLCRALVSDSRFAPVASLSGPPPGQPTDQTQQWSAELYFDETGSTRDANGMAIGGLLLVFPPGVDPTSVHTQFNAAYEPGIESLRQSLRTAAGKPTVKAVLRNPLGLTWFEQQLPTIRAAGVLVAGVRVGGLPISGPADVPFDLLSDDGFGDNLYRRLVRRLLEGVAFALLPQLVPVSADGSPGRVQLGVYGSVRLFDLPTDTVEQQSVLMMETFWGLETEYASGQLAGHRVLFEAADRARRYHQAHEFDQPTPSGMQHVNNLPKSPRLLADLASTAVAMDAALTAMEQADAANTTNPDKYLVPARQLRTVGPDGVRPLMEDVLHLNRCAAFRVYTEYLRAYPVNSAVRHQEAGGNPFHLFVDPLLLAHAASVFDPLLKLGFDDTADDTLEDLLRANRLAGRSDCDDWPEALAIAGGLCLAPPVNRDHSLYRIVGRRLAACAAALPPAQFHRLAGLMK